MRQFILAALALTVSATTIAEPQNPPPANALAGYDKYEMAPIAMGPIIEQWNKDATGGSRGQTLVIEPRIEKKNESRQWWGTVLGRRVRRRFVCRDEIQDR